MQHIPNAVLNAANEIEKNYNRYYVAMHVKKTIIYDHINHEAEKYTGGKQNDQVIPYYFGHDLQPYRSEILKSDGLAFLMAHAAQMYFFDTPEDARRFINLVTSEEGLVGLNALQQRFLKAYDLPPPEIEFKVYQVTNPILPYWL